MRARISEYVAFWSESDDTSTVAGNHERRGRVRAFRILLDEVQVGLSFVALRHVEAHSRQTWDPCSRPRPLGYNTPDACAGLRRSDGLPVEAKPARPDAIRSVRP